MPTLRSAIAGALLTAGILAAPVPSLAQTVGIGTLPQGSLGYAIAAALAKVIDEETDLRARAVGLGGSTVAIPQVNSGEMEFATSNTFESIFATQGTGNFEGRPNPEVRVVAALVPFSVGFMVADASDVRQITDLAGKPFPDDYARQKLVDIMQDAIFEAVGMAPSDIVSVPVPNFVRGAELLAEGQVAGVLLAPGSGVVKQTNAKTPVRFLTIPKTEATEAALSERLPSVRLVEVTPNPNLEGITEPINLLGYQYTLLTHADMDEAAVYAVVKALAEGQEALADAHGIFNRFDPEAMVVDLPGASYHPGAIRYYRERGWWPSE